MDLKLIAIDLDETLLTKDKTYDRERFTEIVNKLTEQDIIVIVITGNSYHKVDDYFDEEELDRLYFACENGNYIVKNNEKVRAVDISRPTYLSIIEFLDEVEGFYPVISVGDKSYFRMKSGDIYDTVKFYNPNLKYIESFEDLKDSDDAIMISVYSENSLEHNKRLTRIITERLDEVRAVTSGEGWIDVYDSSGGKGSAIKYFQDKYDISKDQTMVFGDSLNDESMMQEAKYSIVVENADPDLAYSASYQIGSNEEQAVISTLEQIVDEQSLEFLNEHRLHHKR